MGLLIGCRRGLFKSVMKWVVVLLAFLLAGGAAKAASGWVVEQMKPVVEKSIAAEVERSVDDAYGSFTQSAESYLQDIIDRLPFSVLREGMRDLLEGGEEKLLGTEAKESVSQQVTELATRVAFQPLDESVRAMLYAVLYFVCFLLLLLLLNWLVRLLNLTFRLPLLHSLNCVGGGLFGLLETGLWLTLLLHLADYLLSGEPAQWLAGSAVAQFFLQLDLMKTFLSL